MDTRITLEQTNSYDSGYGASSYSSRESFLDLYRGHRYRLLEVRFSSISAAMDGDGRTRRQSEGEWKIQVSGGAATLLLRGDDGGADYYRIEKASWDAVKLDGRERAWKTL